MTTEHRRKRTTLCSSEESIGSREVSTSGKNQWSALDGSELCCVACNDNGGVVSSSSMLFLLLLLLLLLLSSSLC